MTAPTTDQADVFDVRPGRNEVAVVSLPPGGVARVHHPAGPRDWAPSLPGERLIATIPCDVDHIGWGASICSYLGVRAIRNGRHRRDRAVWDEAVKALRGHAVVYVRMERGDYYGRAVWTAAAVRTEDAR